jgi:hypothetical protein
LGQSPITLGHTARIAPGDAGDAYRELEGHEVPKEQRLLRAIEPQRLDDRYASTASQTDDAGGEGNQPR